MMQRTDSLAGYLHYRTSLEEVAGENPYISEYIEFSFYDWFWYNGNTGLGETKLGKWLGVSNRVGSIMYYWVIKANGPAVSRTDVYRVNNIDPQTDNNKASTTALDKAIQERLKYKYHVIVEGGKGKP